MFPHVLSSNTYLEPAEVKGSLTFPAKLSYFSVPEPGYRNFTPGNTKPNRRDVPVERLRIRWCLNLAWGGKGARNCLSSSSLCSSIAAQIPGTISVLLPSQNASCRGLSYQRCMGRAAGPASATGRLLYWEGHTAPLKGVAATTRVQPLPPLPAWRLKATGQPRINTAGFAPDTTILEPGRRPALGSSVVTKWRPDVLPVVTPG